MKNSQLKSLFNPSSIAVVGASQSPGKAGYEMLHAIHGFDGDIFPVNPKATTILGLTVYKSLSDIGKHVDLVIITLPAKFCLDAVKEAVSIGAKALMIISGGFAESGLEGEKLQQQILDVCEKANICLLGPNTSGFANPPKELAASFAPGVSELTPGSLAVISQSGAINLTISSLAVEQNLGVSLAVGTGNGRNISPADVISYLGDDDQTKVIVMYLEGISDGRKLYDAIRNTAPKKPIIVYTVGKADINEFAASHTGNLIGSYALKKSALIQAGAVVVDSLEELIDAAVIFSTLRLTPAANPGVGLLTGQAGPGMIISDYLQDNNVSMPKLKKATVAKISEMLPPMTYLQNPVDTGRPGENFNDILEAISGDDNIDLLLTFALHEPAAVDPRKIFSSVQNKITKPMVFGTAGIKTSIDPTINSLRKLNIPAFSTPDRTARAVKYLIDDAKITYRCMNSKITLPEPSQSKHVGTKLTEEQSKQLIATIGINSPENFVCDDHPQSIDAFNRINKPCVVKVLSAEITHKTEVAGVHLNVNTEEELLKALQSIDAIDGPSKIQYLIESMAPSGVELIIGAKRDKSFGPTVIVGLGGTIAEALEDVSIRLAPLSAQDAEDMLKGLKGYDVLNGWRGQPALDKKSVENALVSLGDFMFKQAEIEEIDINPIRVYEDKILALDALIVTTLS
jgi:acetyltransferase